MTIEDHGATSGTGSSCPTCGTTIESDAFYCPGCGTSVAVASTMGQPPPPPPGSVPPPPAPSFPTPTPAGTPDAPTPGFPGPPSDAATAGQPYQPPHQPPTQAPYRGAYLPPPVQPPYQAPYRGPYQAPYQPAYFQPAPPGQRTNGMAIASLILGIVWLSWIGSILALIFGYIALGQIKRQHEGGRGMAIAGIVLGWVGVATLILFIVLIAVASTNHGSTSLTP
jgi:hypothetical protein